MFQQEKIMSALDDLDTRIMPDRWASAPRGKKRDGGAMVPGRKRALRRAIRQQQKQGGRGV